MLGVKFTKYLSGLVLAAGICGPLSAYADTWYKAESEHFVVYSNVSAKETEAYVSNLEKYRYVMGAFHQRAEADDLPSPKLDIYFVKGSDDLKKVMPEMGGNILGFARICANGAAAYSLYDGDKIKPAARILDQIENDSQTVLFHEYAHLFMLTYSGVAYPSWFIEGFAEYYGTTRIQDTQVVIGMAWSGRIYTLNTEEGHLSWAYLLQDAPAARQKHVYAYYAQSWLLTHWIMSAPERKKAFTAYLKAIGEGQDTSQAFEAAFGIPVKSLNSVMRKYLNELKATVYGIKDMPTPKISLSPLPATVNNLIMLDSGSRSCLSDAYGPVALAKIRTETAKYPDDAYAKGVLARAEIVLGDEEKALPYYQAYTAANPTDSEGFFRLGQTFYLMAAHNKLVTGETAESQIKKARAALGKAYQLDPLNPVNLYYYSLTGKRGPDYPDDSTLNAAYEAHLLMPSVREYALQAASLLILKNRLSDARGVLIPLANDPHGGAFSQWIADLVAAIDAGKSKDELLKIMRAPQKTDSEEPEKTKSGA
jgi:hypothetical protein